MSKAIVPAAYGQQPMPTRHDARFQEAVTFGAHAAERWMANPGPLSLPQHLEALQCNLPGSTRQPVLDGFLMRIEQHFRAILLPSLAASLPTETDDTANGGHLLYRVDLPNDDASAALIKRVLLAVASICDAAAAKVDISVGNAARIWKLYGTVANKGDNTPAAPWRLSRILEAPEQLGVVTAEQLGVVADILPPPPAPAARSTGVGTGPRFDLLPFLERLGISYKQDRHNNAERYRLEHCPFNEEHGFGEAAIFQLDNGALSFDCKHNSCADKTWHDVRALDPQPRMAGADPAKAFGQPEQTAPAASLEEV